ncbi:heat-shock protein [Halolactibacillus alkaliphilus]|uniref:Heat-shock protein n=1 Tax=Halolactibacillus alkaliphilus TaxID=442899 RepID=A0A511WZJ0_9BACI|nr:Hsp20/alpha crystallin family protein [Halolactibacillus alkaliphilus]GEN56106.1 heat-shock protein [Halolactibacillus alkaliphilus]GGN67180.1 heat-shock protein [Halolactibacillus alkaliphilus]SFO71455.1 HSP20 family protein [Halolactibacillus alkaliphilus]
MGSLFPKKDDFFDLMPRLFDRDRDLFSFSKHDLPKVDVKDKKDHYEIDAELPGFSKENVIVEYKDHYLTIAATRESEVNVEEENFVRQERSTGSFKRQFFVGDVDESKITGAFKNGVLTLTVPKSTEDLAEEKSYRIELD